MTTAKVTQAEADAYMDGWKARHEYQPLEYALKLSGLDRHHRLIFKQGWEDSQEGKLDFSKMMGPDDFEPDVP